MAAQGLYHPALIAPRELWPAATNLSSLFDFTCMNLSLHPQAVSLSHVSPSNGKKLHRFGGKPTDLATPLRLRSLLPAYGRSGCVCADTGFTLRCCIRNKQADTARLYVSTRVIRGCRKRRSPRLSRVRVGHVPL